MKPSLKVTADFTEDFNKAVAKFKNDAVLVGVPAEDASRDLNPNNKEEAPINNATILAINEFGSPINNIPPRPVMAIGIRDAQDSIAEQFANAAKNVLSKGLSALTQYYERAGIIASNSVKKAINNQTEIDPPAEATLKAREAQGFKGTKALIVTGQLRNSITYVVNEGGL